MEKYEFENRLKTAAEDPELKVTADESRLRYQVVKALIGARLAANMSEKELAKRTGIRPGRIDRIENQLTCAVSAICHTKLLSLLFFLMNYTKQKTRFFRYW